MNFVKYHNIWYRRGQAGSEDDRWDISDYIKELLWLSTLRIDIQEDLCRMTKKL